MCLLKIGKSLPTLWRAAAVEIANRQAHVAWVQPPAKLEALKAKEAFKIRRLNFHVRCHAPFVTAVALAKISPSFRVCFNALCSCCKYWFRIFSQHIDFSLYLLFTCSNFVIVVNF